MSTLASTLASLESHTRRRILECFLGGGGWPSLVTPLWLVGIQSEEDIRFIPDDVFELWEQPYYKPMPNPKNKEEERKSVYDPQSGTMTRYPKVCSHSGDHLEAPC